MTVDIKPRLAIIDDNKEFLEQLEKGLKTLFDTQCLPVTKQTRPESLISNLKQFLPDYLVMDSNLISSGQSKRILRKLGEADALPTDCRIWIISQAGHDDQEQILAGFQQIDANVQDRLLPKPVSPQQLWAELTDDSLFEPESLWIDFPMPFRVLSRKGKVLFANKKWKQADYPSPDNFINKKGSITKKEREFTGSFRGEGSSGFTVFSFSLDHYGETFIAQVARIQKLESIKVNLDETLKHVFDAMKLAGFNHGRFYRVRPLMKHKDKHIYEHVLELTHTSYKLTKNVSWPYRLPLRGELKKRFEEHQEKWISDGGSKELHHKIRKSREDKEANDHQVNELNKLLGIKDINSWLEVPVWMNQEHFPGANNSSGNKPTIFGWLFFDRAPTEEKNSGITDSDVTEKKIKPVLPLLRSLIDILVSALWRERLETTWDYERKMLVFDENLVKARSYNERFKLVLDMLIELGEADSGLLVLEDKGKNRLSVTAQSSSLEKMDLSKLCFPLTADHHPIVFAWKKRETYACQDFPHGDFYSRLVDRLSSNGQYPEYLEPLGAIGTQEFIQWIENDIGSLLAIAITLPGDMVKENDDFCLGGITLQYREPQSITRCRKTYIDAVLQRARWVIQHYHYQKTREAWRVSVAHEFKSHLNVVMQNLTELERINSEVSGIPEFQDSMLWIQAARDQAENLMDYERADPPSSFQSKPFVPGEIVSGFLDLTVVYQLDEGVRVILDPDDWDDPVWKQELTGDGQFFGRAIRELIFNALKYGRYFAEKGAPVELSVAVCVNDDNWVISVTNPGCIQTENLDPPDKPAGARIGFSMVCQLVENCGGSLELKESGNKRVCAQMNWPIIEK